MQDNKQEKIREQAYRIWESEGRPEGRHEEHWQRAERIVESGDGYDSQTSAGSTGDTDMVGKAGLARQQEPSAEAIRGAH